MRAIISGCARYPQDKSQRRVCKTGIRNEIRPKVLKATARRLLNI
jgi:hypothetical protein